MKISVNKYFSRGLLVLGSYIFVVVMIGVLLTAPVTMADSSGVDKFTLTLRSSCTIESTNGAHIATVDNNQRYLNLGGNPTTFTVYCNDKDGYIVYTIGASNNVEGNTNLIGSTGSNIPTGLYIQGDTTSSWAFRIDKIDSSLTMNPTYAVGENDFAMIPDTWAWIAKKENGTTDSTTGSKITATYSAYISGTQAAGTYTGQVKYALFHPDSVTTPVTLARAFQNAGKAKVPATDPITGDSGDFYTMQDMTTAICDATNVYGEASQLQLVDTRDGKLYWATKLSNDGVTDHGGQCWMTENLDLDLETDQDTQTEQGTVISGNVTNLTSENTNLTLYGDKGYTSANGYSCSNDSPTCEGGVITWIPERATIPPTELSSTTWKNDNASPYSYDRGAAEPDGHKDGHGYSGNYYNWTAAIASNASGDSGGNAANSVCPKGWRLPNTRAEEGGYEFSKLLYAYDITTNDQNTAGYAGSASAGLAKITSNPLYFVRSGFLYGGSFYNLGSGGHYWSSAVINGVAAYYLEFTGSNVNPANDYNFYNRNSGRSVRCVAE